VNSISGGAAKSRALAPKLRTQHTRAEEEKEEETGRTKTISNNYPLPHMQILCYATTKREEIYLSKDRVSKQ
jgi:hypothetical protein